MDLSAYVKYCLGYIRLTRNFSLGKEAESVSLSDEQLHLVNVTSADLETDPKLLLNFKTFYEYESADVPPNLQTIYNHEKRTAKALEGIYHKHRNNQFTKQVQLRFGYFTVQIPLGVEAPGIKDEEDDEEPTDSEVQIETKEVSFPLFSVTVDGAAP